MPELSIIFEAMTALPETSYIIASDEFVKKLLTIFVSIQPSSHQKLIVPTLSALVGADCTLPLFELSKILLRNIKFLVCATLISAIVQ